MNYLLLCNLLRFLSAGVRLKGVYCFSWAGAQHSPPWRCTWASLHELLAAVFSSAFLNYSTGAYSFLNVLFVHALHQMPPVSSLKVNQGLWTFMEWFKSNPPAVNRDALSSVRCPEPWLAWPWAELWIRVRKAKDLIGIWSLFPPPQVAQSLWQLRNCSKAFVKAAVGSKQTPQFSLHDT